MRSNKNALRLLSFMSVWIVINSKTWTSTYLSKWLLDLTQTQYNIRYLRCLSVWVCVLQCNIESLNLQNSFPAVYSLFHFDSLPHFNNNSRTRGRVLSSIKNYSTTSFAGIVPKKVNLLYGCGYRLSPLNFNYDNGQKPLYKKIYNILRSRARINSRKWRNRLLPRR